MSVRPKTAKWIWLLVAAAAMGGAARLEGPLDGMREEYELVPPGDYLNERHPEMALVSMLPGGLRAWAVNFLWIRSQNLHQEERYYDARQRAEWICMLTPHHPGVWVFLAWELTWNISANTHTPEERWNWVRHGMELLRDEGIPRNPQALILYRELAWIFFFKMGLYTDEMHMTYKQRWAAQMQHVLGAPPYGTTAEAIEAFRPVARAAAGGLLDKDPRRQGKDPIQPDMRARLLGDDEAVAAYARLLAAHKVGVDESLLTAYNRFSLADAAGVVRRFPPTPESDRDKAVSDLINAPEHAEARAKMLAFVRAQLLWNRYRMDPEWMLLLMERYGPLDWRQVMTNGLYWVTYGLHVVKDVDRAEIDALNTERIVLNCLKTLTWTGRMTYVEDPEAPESPDINWLADWRFINPTQKEFLRAIDDVMKDRREKAFKSNILKEGHVNYLVSAMAMLYAGYRRGEAGRLFEWAKDNYEPGDDDWKMDMEDFIVSRLRREGAPIREIADSQITAALIAAFQEMGDGRQEDYARCFRYALRVHRLYQKPTPDRLKLPAFDIYVRTVLINLLVRPQIFYARLPLEARITIYASVDPRVQVLLYDMMAPAVRAECQRNGLDFNRSFPAPPGLNEYRARRRQRLAPAGSR